MKRNKINFRIQNNSHVTPIAQALSLESKERGLFNYWHWKGFAIEKKRNVGFDISHNRYLARKNVSKILISS